MRYCLVELEVNNIAIKLEKINFDKDTKEELNKFAKTYRMEVEYYYGYISKFDKLNTALNKKPIRLYTIQSNKANKYLKRLKYHVLSISSNNIKLDILSLSYTTSWWECTTCFIKYIKYKT